MKRLNAHLYLQQTFLLKALCAYEKEKMFSTMTSHRRINQEKCRKTFRLRLVCSALLTTNNIPLALQKLFINFFSLHKTLSRGKLSAMKTKSSVFWKKYHYIRNIT